MQNLHLIKTENEPLVSVIVTTKNEEKNIENCILSIKNQTYPNIELIIVDNFSTDRTVEIAKKYTENIFSKGNERSVQRNHGAKVARGKYLIYLDADMILSPNVIQQCVTKSEFGLIDAIYIPERIIGQGLWIKIRDFERSFYTGTVVDAVRFVRKELFFQVGGFDENLVGPEDWDFDRKVRSISRPAVIVAPIYHNEGRFNLTRYLKKKVYYADGIRKYAQKWGDADLEIAKQIGFGYRFFGIFIENGKWKRLLRYPLFTFGLYFLRLGVAIAYLLNR
ncbi:TPA: glycosyltransferase [bacterium]|nr:glycosyltransferase [bacterium]